MMVDPSLAPPAEVVDEVLGEGAAAEPGVRVVLHYATTLAGSADEIDGSRGRGRPLRAILGRGELVRGLEAGLVGMRVGGRRRVIVPPQHGYGPKGLGEVIPPLTDVIFDVELLAVETGPWGQA
ncbi:MAG: FKBP-type peptidyl-prolyl cis-trans isomerase [Myxococcales bacterium]|nr:FKBP-type peptidyl-prolyl cis-trans isomerase [Myxococcales bacterium]